MIKTGENLHRKLTQFLCWYETIPVSVKSYMQLATGPKDLNMVLFREDITIGRNTNRAVGAKQNKLEC